MNKLEKGKQLYNSQQYNESIEALTDFLNEQKNHADALFFRALSYRKVGKFNLSINDLNIVINKLPDEATLYSERGVSYYHLKDFKTALRDLDIAVSLEPNKSYRYSSRAYIRAHVDVEGAIKDYEKAIDLDPKDEIALNNLGLLQENVGRIKEAQKNFKRSNEIIGYNPEKRTENTAPKQKKDDTLGKIMLDVFRKKETQQEFLSFLKILLKKK